MTVSFETCTAFRPSHDDDLVCACGWLEDDHDAGVAETIAILARMRPRRPAITVAITVPERRAS
jgi:hypothetical protein